LWNRVFEAIGPFLRANTDSSEMAEQSEVVEMVGAFERALGVWGDRLKGEFHRHFKPTADISPRDAPRIPPALRNGLSVRHLWMGDLYDLRNAHAHGDQVQPADLMWDRMEHLLLGAYAFPLLVKSLLSEEQLYQLTAQDQKAIDVFEPFARVKGHLLERLRDEGGNEHLRWDEVKSDFAWERVHAQLQGRATSRERDSDSGEAP
jgi:hypothetical protein